MSNKAKWYEVLEPSYIGDRLYQTGETVQYEGEAGPNLKEITVKEAKEQLKEEQEPDETDLKAREIDLSNREKEIIDREKAVTEQENALREQKQASDLRVAELDDREKALAEKEALVVKAAEPLPVDLGKSKK